MITIPVTTVVRAAIVMSLGALIGAIVGCAALDTFTGANQAVAAGGSEPAGGAIPGSPASTVSFLLGQFIPWAGAAVGALSGLYASIRRRRYLRALESVVRGVNEVRRRKDEQGRIHLDEQTLMAVFSAMQDKEGTRQTVRDVVHRVEKKEKQ